MPSYPSTHLAYGIYVGFNAGYGEPAEPTYKPINKHEKIIEEMGCDIVYFSLYQDSYGMALVVKESIITPTGAAIEIGTTLPVAKPEWDNILKRACEELGLNYKPQWILCCSYG